MQGQFIDRAGSGRWMAATVGQVIALAGGALTLQGLLFSTAIAQQIDGARGGVAPVCAVESTPVEQTDESSAEGESTATIALYASCSGTGIYLGEADRYEVVTHAATGALVVEIERLGRTRVTLLATDNGQVFAEDLTGTLAVAAGRTPTGGLRGLTPDLAQFDVDGSIGVTAFDSLALRSGEPATRFSLEDHLAVSRSYRAAARTAQAESGQ